MSLSVPVNPPTVNEAVAKASSTGTSLGIAENETKVNQLHGIASNNALGAGIPKQVSNVKVSIANAATGATCTVAVLFSLDPSDKNFSGISIWVTGYQGNSNPVQVGSGTSSPTKIVLNNTGETVTFTIQAFGNGGSAPFNQSPTCSGTLPKSTAGGFGSSTVISSPSVSGSATPGQLAKFGSPATTVTGADLSGDATTSGSTVVTVAKLRGVTLGSGAPFDQQVLRYVAANLDWEPSLAIAPFWAMHATNGAASGVLVSSIGMYNNGSGSGATASGIAATATLPPAQQVKTTNVGSTTGALISASSSAGGTNVPGIRNFRQIVFKLALLQTTNMRIWIGMGTTNSTTTWSADTPNVGFVGFRFSTAAGDAKYRCITQSSNVAITNNAESTASHVDTSLHTFELRWDDTNVIFLIDGVQVGSQSTNLPAVGTGLFPIMVIDNVNTANAQGFNFYYAGGSGRPF